MERASVAAAADLRLGGAGLAQGLFGEQRDERMQPVVSLGDPVKESLGQFDWGELTALQQLPRFADRQVVQLLVNLRYISTAV